MNVTGFDTVNNDVSDAGLSFGNVQVTQLSTGATNSINGSMRLQQSYATNTETLTANLVLKDGAGGEGALQNFVMTNVYDNIATPASVSETISGRVYDSVEGYVDITTPVAMNIVNLATDLYPTTGQIILTGDVGAVGGATTVRVTAQSSTTVLIEADTTGDGVYDYSSGVVNWSSV